MKYFRLLWGYSGWSKYGRSLFLQGKSRPVTPEVAGRALSLHSAELILDISKWEKKAREVCYHFCYPTPEHGAGQGGIRRSKANTKAEQNQPYRYHRRLLGTAASELQNRVHQFNSGRGFHLSDNGLRIHHQRIEGVFRERGDCQGGGGQGSSTGVVSARNKLISLASPARG
jgi:hypothetical protein